MKLVPLNSHLEPVFSEYVYRNIPHYYFFIFDMKHDRASTEILLALNEQNQIEGMMLTYQERIVQIRGNIEAAKALLAQLDLEKPEIQVAKEHKNLISERFGKVKKTFDLELMTLKKGEESLTPGHPVERLSIGDAEDMALMMRESDPNWWGEITGEKIAAKMHERLWLGMRVDNQLVSIASTILCEWGSNIGTVVTHEDHRNKGYATSLVSALVDQIFKTSDLALVHVESDNIPAVKVYTKVGFRPYRRYYVARVEKSD